jgi:ArsR family metal-binding transcriptional regulator
MKELITHYETEIIEPGCSPGSGRYGLRIVVVEDISEVMPYINSAADNAWYDHENRTLILKEPGQAYALRPHEIRMARLAEPSRATEISREVVAKINALWADRHRIHPRFDTRKQPSVIDVLRLLPRTNCRECGHATCLAFAAALRSSEADVDDCLPIRDGKHDPQRQKLAELCDLRGEPSGNLFLISPT